MAETIRGAGRLTASLITAIWRRLIASTMLHPGSVASTSTVEEEESEWESAKTRKSGCKWAAGSRRRKERVWEVVLRGAVADRQDGAACPRQRMSPHREHRGYRRVFSRKQ